MVSVSILPSLFLAKMFTMSIKCHILTSDTSTLNTSLQMENKQNKVETLFILFQRFT